MVTSGRGRVKHRSFLQLSDTHMKCKKWVIERLMISSKLRTSVRRKLQFRLDRSSRWSRRRMDYQGDCSPKNNASFPQSSIRWKRAVLTRMLQRSVGVSDDPEMLEV